MDLRLSVREVQSTRVLILWFQVKILSRPYLGIFQSLDLASEDKWSDMFRFEVRVGGTGAIGSRVVTSLSCAVDAPIC